MRWVLGITVRTRLLGMAVLLGAIAFAVALTESFFAHHWTEFDQAQRQVEKDLKALGEGLDQAGLDAAAAGARGGAIVEATVTTLHGLQENASGVAKAVHEIEVAAGEQPRTSDAVAKQVEVAAQDIERSATATMELSRTVEEVRRTSEQLAITSRALVNSVRQFRLD